MTDKSLDKENQFNFTYKKGLFNEFIFHGRNSARSSISTDWFNMNTPLNSLLGPGRVLWGF